MRLVHACKNCIREESREQGICTEFVGREGWERYRLKRGCNNALLWGVERAFLLLEG
jgi:hypothetical protein